MKKTKLFGLALVATMASFSACSNDAEEVLTQESEIRLTSEITPSRVTSLDYQSTQIVEGQQVGVTITGAKSTHNNVAWTAGADGALANTGADIYYSGNNTATITAYHPYNSTWTGTSHTFSVNTDQSTDAGYLASDLLWVTKTATKTEDAVALTFAHKLAKINVTLVPEYEGTDLSNATISICNTKPSTTFTLADGSISAATGNVQEIKAGVTTSNAYTASAIVVPQTLASGTQFIKVVHGTKTFYYTLSSEKELKSGYSHNYTLTVKEKQVVLTTESDEITDWVDDNNNTGDAEEVDLSWFNPNQYISYVANEESQSNTDPNAMDYFYNCRSYITWPYISSFCEIECKFQIATPPTYWNDDIVVCGPIYFNETAHILGGEYSWSELGTQMTDRIVLNISLIDKSIKLNDSDIEYKIDSSRNSYSTSGLIFSDYYRDYDEGEYKDWSGVPIGSKLYYIKLWNEDDELIYLGAASTALNPATNEVENCWRSYYNGAISYQFAHNSETLSNYQPYGGGVDGE